MGGRAGAVAGREGDAGDPVWTDAAADRAQAAAFFARVISLDTRYISHGEIQCGLSPDGTRWADDLDARFAEDLADPDPGAGLLLMRSAGGAIVAAAIVEWVETPRVRFAVLADLAVDPALRSGGTGARMVAAIEAEARRRAMGWIFLESGKDNARAHAFFERHAFREISHVFGKRLA